VIGINPAALASEVAPDRAKTSTATTMGDEYDDGESDYDEWFYVEDTYLVADDLAEHAINSPPPTTYADDDAMEEWDRFEYYCDLEYGSDGYDDENFRVRDPVLKTTETRQIRERPAATSKVKTRRKKRKGPPASGPFSRQRSLSPLPTVVWRSQDHMPVITKQLEDNQTSFALLPNWRELVQDFAWGKRPAGVGSELKREPIVAPSVEEDDGTSTPESASSVAQPNEDTAQDIATGAIDSDALMAALQNRLSDLPGPLNELLNGMDTSRLLECALRMVNGDGTEDDIADELADDLLDGAEEDTSTDLASWLSQQRGKEAGDNVMASASHDDLRNPNAFPSETKSEMTRITSSNAPLQGSSQPSRSLKRRASRGEDERADLASSSKARRIAKPHDASTTAKRGMAGRQP
jgi:hypothetical protein